MTTALCFQATVLVAALRLILLGAVAGTIATTLTLVVAGHNDSANVLMYSVAAVEMVLLGAFLSGTVCLVASFAQDWRWTLRFAISPSEQSRYFAWVIRRSVPRRRPASGLPG